MIAVIAALRHHYRGRDDVYVIGNIFLYYQERNPAARRSPDVMVIKGVPALPERTSFKTWVENAVPCAVIELTSNETKEEDQGPKKELYERLGVREYFLFDPLGDYLPRPLLGYRLVRTAEESAAVNGGEVEARYEELPPAQDGGLLSAELGLRLVPDGEDLALIDCRTGERVPTPLDLYRQVLEVTRRAQQAEEAAQEAERRRLEAERQGQEAERRRQEAERRRLEAVRQSEEAERQRLELERQRLDAVREREEAVRHSEEAVRQRLEAVRLAEQAEGRAREEARKAEELQRELDRLRKLLPPGGAGRPGTG
jgi:Uma2 family endonuclease